MANASTLEYKDCVRDATVESFSMLCGMEITLEGVGTERSASESSIVAVISILGDVEWSVIVNLPKESADAIAPKFAGFEIPFDSEDMGDAVGELCNIVAGAVKAKLDGLGKRAEISLPSVMRGSSVQVLSYKGLPIAIFNFASECGSFAIEVVGSPDVVPTKKVV